MKISDKELIEFIDYVLKDARPHNWETDGDLIGVPNEPPKNATILKNGWITFVQYPDKRQIFYEDHNSYGSNCFFIVGEKLEKDEDDFYDFISIFKGVFKEEIKQWQTMLFTEELQNKLASKTAIKEYANKI